ncbi:UDP-N-acetylmuramate dehydrogenase [Kytococcus sedentarius]|uniref:UDP-N-acetylenolpyruvoylglucosamine reductase n=1 Tax=Kytococcus sedentarius (strain ATCC 14392 / DSM 20547 / JCM 11482 / CCUG 33030 / NBRC 15357 / NCTC 11040 / CCM 314 / 541) TaxID=478801 RepID=C7NL17_KYTSD|nr:UDP-N-acetylmuramate dehydrogenase [Kytococcus sedentarius]ACV07108.1 UDP-N-acetylmuramate dehydrogenase [Kytococcus sedentarius DSM 20547]QQB63095.1 UDP-N-acetylmuramate dehydrogenase [Kytococcus sedentarius]STX14062.1 UDP-N-acetylenolpyruvoylglucosamine reductase [Kytococcus sedentarius]
MSTPALSEASTVEHDAPLAPLTTLRVGGPARTLVRAGSTDDLVAAVRAADEAGEDLLLVSGGSNLVISDAGFAGTVVQVATRGIELLEDAVRPAGDGGEPGRSGERVLVRAAAGEPWDGFVAHAVEQGWSGVEALSGIPGCVGSTPIQNVGAYGQDVSQTITGVEVLDRDSGELERFSAADCGFAYRDSVFKRTRKGSTGRYVVLAVTFSLERSELSQPVGYAALAQGLDVAMGERVPLADAREAVLAQRRQRGMVWDADDHDTWSCGSFFTNPIITTAQMDDVRAHVIERMGPNAPEPPEFDAGEGLVKTSAAWLIDKAGYGKGYAMPGPAALSTKHPLAITNRGGARAADVANLAREIREGVEDAFGVRLVNEPVFVGHQL